MGRKKKYSNDEELKAAKAKQWKEYYERNKETINTHRMKKYYENKSTENLS